MSGAPLVLSLFPGIGLLDMAFELEGFCIVRGPDVIWGGDANHFHPPRGIFAGVIGGPPCQEFTALAHLVRHNGHKPRFGNLIPLFESIVAEAAPEWFLMENVPEAPLPAVDDRVWPKTPAYQVSSVVLDDAAMGGLTSRTRRFSFGRPWDSPNDGWFRVPELVVLHSEPYPAVTTDPRDETSSTRVRRKPGGGILPRVGKVLPWPEVRRRQGLPDDFLEIAPFGDRTKRHLVGEGVPLPMGRAVAKAVKRAIGLDLSSVASPQDGSPTTEESR